MTGRDGRVERMLERRWEGHVDPKPWQRKVTATFAHLETPELVPVVVDLLRLQTADPHVIIVDTGSSPETCRKLERLRAPEVEIHYIRSHAYRHPSAPVSAACDLAMTLSLSPYLFMTHVDCFLRQRDFLARLIADCGPKVPVIGYRMSDRSFLRTNDWKWMVSHTATMIHIPTIRKARALWAIEVAHDTYGYDRPATPGGWPDTETAFNLTLKAGGITPKFIGDETNYERHLDDEVDHCLAGETLVMTREGPQRIADLAGTSPELLVRNIKRLYQGQRDAGQWKRAPIRSFGEQPLMRVTLSRGAERREVLATAEHRWFADGNRPVKERRLREVTTSGLTAGDRLVSVWPRSSAYSLHPSPFGAARGYVFGDGTRDARNARVRIWGDQTTEILPLFAGHRTSNVLTENGVPGVEVLGLPHYFKDTPPLLGEAPGYLFGWLAGYFAADGRVSRGGRIELVSVDPENLDAVRRVAETLGIATYAVTGRKRRGYLDEPAMIYSVGFVASSLTSGFFLLAKHRSRFDALTHRTARAWYVESVEPTDRVEEVYCAQVEGYECFALADNLLTGNCRSFPGSALYSDSYHTKAQRWIDVAVGEAKARAKEWRAGRDTPPDKPRSVPAPRKATAVPTSGGSERQPSVIREMVLRLPVKAGSEVTIEQGGGLADLFSDASGGRVVNNPFAVRTDGEVRAFMGRGTYRVKYRTSSGGGAVTTTRVT